MKHLIKNNSFLIFSFLLLQFFVCYFFNIDKISYFLLAETFFFYLIVEEIFPFVALIPYFFIVPSAAVVLVFFILIYKSVAEKNKISVKISLILFLFLYFFAARYEYYLFKAVMPGFIAFVAVIYSITRMPETSVLLGKAIAVYVIVGFVYGLAFNFFSFFKYEPFLMFSVDLIQLVIAVSMFVSFGKFLKEESPHSDN